MGFTQYGFTVMKTYEHGGQIEAFAREVKCTIEEVIDLSSNINFVKPKMGIDFNALHIASYPTYEKLYSAIAKNYGIKKRANGALQWWKQCYFFSLFNHLNFKRVLYTLRHI